MTNPHATQSYDYKEAMGRLLVLYTQIDQLIMEVCAERIAGAPDQETRLGLAKQVGDEGRHVAIQQEWIRNFGVDCGDVIDPAAQEAIRAHFRRLPWDLFLADLYVAVEALGSQAVEEIVPLADPGTRKSLEIPLRDELDHIAFGLGHLKKALASMPPSQRREFLAALPGRIGALVSTIRGILPELPQWFAAVGADYGALCRAVSEKRSRLLQELEVPLAA